MEIKNFYNWMHKENNLSDTFKYYKNNNLLKKLLIF